MMKPEKVAFWVYAESAEEVQELQSSLNAFVREQYGRGVLVTASKLSEALKRFGGNALIGSYLNRK